MKRARKHKYNAQPTEVDGILFDSKAEARRYGELKLLQRAGQISELTLQPDFPLHAPDGTLIGRYIADFAYIESKTNQPVIEDVKGVKTSLYRWKKKHTEAEHGVKITEVN